MVGVGWTLYPPLSTTDSPARHGVRHSVVHLAAPRRFWAPSIHPQIFNMRSPGMTLHKMPLFVCPFFHRVPSPASLPVLAAHHHLLTDRNFGTSFFLLQGRRSHPLQHLSGSSALRQFTLLIFPSSASSRRSFRPSRGNPVRYIGMAFVVASAWSARRAHHMFTLAGADTQPSSWPPPDQRGATASRFLCIATFGGSIESQAHPGPWLISCSPLAASPAWF